VGVFSENTVFRMKVQQETRSHGYRL